MWSFYILFCILLFPEKRKLTTNDKNAYLEAKCEINHDNGKNLINVGYFILSIAIMLISLFTFFSP